VIWIFRCVLPSVALVLTQMPFARAAEHVDLLLALAMDVSRSMDQSKFTMQREGYAAAIANPQVLSAIRSGAHQKIAICFIDWSGPFEHRFVRARVDEWTPPCGARRSEKDGRNVTADRLINADKEPQNWLMYHRTYDAQRYSPLDRIKKANAKDLKLAYAVALGGTSANTNLESTPLAEDGYLYVVDQWGVLYKIDGRSGDLGRILWRMDPSQEKLPLANRGAGRMRQPTKMRRSCTWLKSINRASCQCRGDLT
jgi:hypothetical protein